MKRGFVLLATVTLSSALYAQQTLTHQAVQQVFAQYNPPLINRAGQDNQLQALIDQVINTVVAKNQPDTLENRYTLIALVRNFENSLILQALTAQYKQALLYAQLGDPATAQAAYEYTRPALIRNYARMWAASVQVKEALLKEYQQAYRLVPTDTHLTGVEQKARRARLNSAMQALRADIKQLRSRPGIQLTELADQVLDGAAEQVQAAWAALGASATDNLQIKTKHKKPVAE